MTSGGRSLQEAQFEQMNKTRIVVAAALSALLSFSLVAPATASRVFNPDTNMWEDASAVRAKSKRGSPIARQMVDYETKLKPGTIVVETSERRLYLVLENGKAMKYGIGVGRDGFRWSGQHKITRMAEWPGWTPPTSAASR